MPSPVKGGYYKRKGGAWSRTGRAHSYRKVGYGRGTHSKRDVHSDNLRRARQSRKVARYPQHYDSP